MARTDTNDETHWKLLLFLCISHFILQALVFTVFTHGLSKKSKKTNL